MSCACYEFTYKSSLEELGEDQFNYLRFLKRHGAIRNSLNCPHIGELCREIPGLKLYRCSKMRYPAPSWVKCNILQSIRINSWLSDSHLRLKVVCRFICTWLLVPHPRHYFLKKELGISNGTVVKWSHFCWEICLYSLLMRGNQFIGGEGIVVEVHKAKLAKKSI